MFAHGVSAIIFGVLISSGGAVRSPLTPTAEMNALLESEMKGSHDVDGAMEEVVSDAMAISVGQEPLLIFRGHHCKNFINLGNRKLFAKGDSLEKCMKLVAEKGKSFGCEGSVFQYYHTIGDCGCATDGCGYQTQDSNWFVYKILEGPSPPLVAKGHHCSNMVNLRVAGLWKMGGSLTDCMKTMAGLGVQAAGCDGSTFQYNHLAKDCGCSTDACSAKTKNAEWFVYKEPLTRPTMTWVKLGSAKDIDITLTSGFEDSRSTASENARNIGAEVSVAATGTISYAPVGVGASASVTATMGASYGQLWSDSVTRTASSSGSTACKAVCKGEDLPSGAFKWQLYQWHTGVSTAVTHQKIDVKGCEFVCVPVFPDPKGLQPPVAPYGCCNNAECSEGRNNEQCKQLKK